MILLRDLLCIGSPAKTWTSSMKESYLNSVYLGRGGLPFKLKLMMSKYALRKATHIKNAYSTLKKSFMISRLIKTLFLLSKLSSLGEIPKVLCIKLVESIYD